MATNRTPAQRAQIERVRPLAAAWHATPEGRESARRAAQIFWEKRETVTCVCERCGNEFQTPYPDRAQYCSPNCQRAVREKSHAFDIRVKCPECGIEFWQNKYKHTPVTCSRICGQKLRRQEQ
ncbi:MAG TPA: hypothetical protein VGH54_23410 [Mycobacterium sp.]|jgi:hypothetical protein|uniref:hypothetical protein n=1 Tax=Mycobacterium sp. TaxID=1785 RepID=UPI002F4238FC